MQPWWPVQPFGGLAVITGGRVLVALAAVALTVGVPDLVPDSVSVRVVAGAKEGAAEPAELIVEGEDVAVVIAAAECGKCATRGKMVGVVEGAVRSLKVSIQLKEAVGGAVVASGFKIGVGAGMIVAERGIKWAMGFCGEFFLWKMEVEVMQAQASNKINKTTIVLEKYKSEGVGPFRLFKGGREA